MSDIVLETVRAAVMGAIVFYLWWVGRAENLGRQGGWPFIIAGFVLIFVGGVIDITDNFDGLNRYVVIGDTRYEALLEKVGGFLAGFCLLAIGFWKWLPAMVARWKAEKELQSAYGELAASHKQLLEAQGQIVRSERLAVVGQLAGGVAHDLRNPLGAITNAVYYVKRRLEAGDLPGSNPRIGQFLQITQDEVEHADRIIADLLTFARLAPPTFSAARLDRLIDEALSRVEIRKNVRVERRIDPDLPDVLVDGDQVRRVFANLTANAQDAMPDGGVLAVIARTVDGHAEVAFRDTGVGISGEDMDKMFDPLFTTKTKGTGLGLSICVGIVSQHQGTIEVENHPGEGTTVAVRLPLNAQRQAEARK